MSSTVVVVVVVVVAESCCCCCCWQPLQLQLLLLPLRQPEAAGS